MNLKKIFYLFFIVSAFLKVNAQDLINVEDAIKIGLKNNYDIQIARNNAEISENNLQRGTANFLPTLDASGNFSLSETKQTTNSPFSFGNSNTENLSAQVNLNWTLFDGFRMFADNERYNELAKLGEFQARNIIENSVVRIMRAYFNLVQQELLLDVAENSLKISKERFNQEKVRNELGGASSTDLLNAQVAFNNDRSTVISRELQVEIAKKELNILLARDPEEELNVDTKIEINKLEYDYQQLIALAEKRNSALKVATQNKLVAEANKSIASSALYPRLNLSGTYGYTDRTVSTDSDRFAGDVTTQSTDGSIGLTLSINLFNGLRDDVSIQNAEIELKNQTLALENQKNLLAGLVREKYVTFQKRMETVEIEEINVKAAKQNLELQKERYQVGSTTSLAFRDAQINLARAETALVSAKYQARITLLEIEQLIGAIEIK